MIYRANALNLRTKGLSLAEVGDFLEITSRTVLNIETKYEEFGLDRAFHDGPRPGAPIDLEQHDLEPWRQRSGCVPRLDDEFIERMEDVLRIYGRPYDEESPAICLDEKPIQLLEDVRPVSGIAPGEERKVDYEYKRKGTANVFCAIEALRGEYWNRVTETRTALDFVKFLASIERQYPLEKKIILIMDNLNIRAEKPLIEFYGDDEGCRIWSRFEVHYTPKHGSCLNQAEIAIGKYSRQCLGKTRIPDIEALRKQTNAWNKIANRKKVTINWKFSRKKAREKFDYKK